VLDEPTNDLDIEMLEVLEEKLVQYDGSLIIVSHDREFLDNVVTSILVFEEDGSVSEYVGGYSDWLKHGKDLRVSDTPDFKTPKIASSTASPSNTSSTASAPAAKPIKKLSYKLQRELDGLPAKIEQIEAEVEKLQKALEDPAFYDKPFSETQPILESLTAHQQSLEAATERWIELDEQQNQ